MNFSFDVDSTTYRLHRADVDAWAARALPDKGFQTFRVDLVDEGVLRVHKYVETDGKIRAPLETYTEELTVAEMPNLAWFDR